MTTHDTKAPERMDFEEFESRVLGCLDDFADMTPEPPDSKDPSDEGESWEGCMACAFDLAAEKIGRLFAAYQNGELAALQARLDAARTVATLAKSDCEAGAPISTFNLANDILAALRALSKGGE